MFYRDCFVCFHIHTDSTQTPQEYEKEYDKRRQLKRLDVNKFHGFAYDGTWVTAKVLTRVMETVRYRERYSIHRNFTVTEQEMGQMILEAMDKINFFGVTVGTTFQSNYENKHNMHNILSVYRSFRHSSYTLF